MAKKKIKRETVGVMQFAQKAYCDLQQAQIKLHIMVQDLLPVEASEAKIASDALLNHQIGIGVVLRTAEVEIED